MRNKLIIVEGAQGVGKSTVTTLLREQMPYTNLLRLTGTSDKSPEGREKVFTARNSELNAILSCVGCDVNFILDRSHITEQVYCRLGFKDYGFTYDTNYLNRKLQILSKNYDVTFILLTATYDEFSERLNRDKPTFIDVHFDAQNSINQQEIYKDELRKLEQNYGGVRCYEVPTSGRDPYDIVYDILETIRKREVC